MSYWPRRRRRTSHNQSYLKRQSKMQQLRALASSPINFYNTVFGPSSHYIASIYGLRDLLYYSPQEIKEEETFAVYFGDAVANLFNKETCEKKTIFGRLKSHNQDWPRFIRASQTFLRPGAKEKIVDSIIKNNNNFYSNAKKMLSQISTSFIEQGNPKSLDILQEFYRTIPTEDFDKLIDKIPEGLNNPKAKEILSKTKLFEYLKFDEETVNNNPKEKIKLVKAVAKTPTLIKRLPFVLEMDASHIKKIAPATRFKFVQFAFNHHIDRTKRTWYHYYGKELQRLIDQRLRRFREDKLKIAPIDPEVMKEMLFSVCLQKHDEFSTWMEGYQKYWKRITATTIFEAQEDYK